MRLSTFLCLKLTKVFELMLLIVLTAFLIAGCVQLIEDLDGKAIYLTVLSIIACVLALFNIFYNNLVTNVRFYCKLKNKCFSFFCWDAINPVICNCFLSNVCLDRCCSVGTAVKWVFKVSYIAVLVGLIKAWKNKNNIKYIGLTDLSSGVDERTSIQFENLLIIYGLQHVIFIVLRPLLFFIWTFFTCCCNHDDEVPENYDFDMSLVSFDYVKKQFEYF